MNEEARLRKAALRRGVVAAVLQQTPEAGLEERVIEPADLSNRAMRRKLQKQKQRRRRQALASKQEETAARSSEKLLQTMHDLQGDEVVLQEQAPKLKPTRKKRSGRLPTQEELEVAGSLSLTGTLRGKMRRQLLAFVDSYNGLAPAGESFACILIKDVLDGLQPAINLTAAADVYGPFADAYLKYSWTSDMAGEHLTAVERKTVLRCAALASPDF